MAAYAATVTLSGLTPHVAKIAPGVGVLLGTVDVTNYNSTLAEITDITKKFIATPTVLLSTVGDNGGHWGIWVEASKSVKCFEIDTGALAEADLDDDCGSFHFIAVGQI